MTRHSYNYFLGILFSVTTALVLLLVPLQVSIATSVRNCSSIEGSQLAANGSGEVYRVASESMSPLLNLGDMVAVEKNVTFDRIQVGDIIVFREPIPISEEPGSIISRVIEVTIDPVGQLVFVTKGDANSGSVPGIDFPIYERDFIGVVDCLVETGNLEE
jgi:signal peptidase I